MIVRCVIELDGKLQDCKIIKGLPYMDSAVLDALSTHTYTPVTFQGRPQRVNYTFNIKMVLPK
jgi:protein TonB